MSKLTFLRLCWASAFTGAWAWLGAVSAIVGIALPAAVWIAGRIPPAKRGFVSRHLTSPGIPDLVWFLPLAVAAVVLLYRLFFVAPYDIFKAEERKRAAAELARSLHLRFDRIATGQHQTISGTTVTIVASVANNGPPTVAENFRLEMTLPGRVPLAGQPVILPADTQIHLGWGSDGEALVLSGRDYLPEKTLVPIPTGGIARGVLMFNVPVPLAEVHSGSPTFRLSCVDVNGREFHEDFEMGAARGSGPTGHVPGVGEQIVKEDAKRR